MGLFAAGLSVVAMRQWYLWITDKRFVEERSEAPAPPPFVTWMHQPMVSVLATAWNEAENIPCLLHSFLELQYPPKELILSAGGEDGSYELAAGIAEEGVRVIRQLPGKGKQHALVDCLQEAEGEFIYLTDADCVLDSENFERLLYPLICSEEAAATGSSRPLKRQSKSPFVNYQWSPRRYVEVKNMATYGHGLMGRNCIVKRGPLEEAWAAIADVSTGTDYYLALRLKENGHRILRVTASTVESEYPDTLPKYVRQQTRWLRNLLLWGYRFGDWPEVRHALVSAAVGAAMLMGPFGSAFLGSSAVVVWLLILIYGVLSRIRYMDIVNAVEHRHHAPVSPAALFVMFGDFVAWARIWLDFWHPTRKNRW